MTVRGKPPRIPSLRTGDLIAVAAPSGPVRREVLVRGAEFIAASGFQVTYREDIFARDGYLAGDDRRRSEELNRYFRDPKVKAILMARGGYGASRIVDRLDTAPLGRHPKIIVGYSDATALLLLLMRARGAALFHGPFVSDPSRDLSRLLRVISGNVEPLIIRGLRPLRPGSATAPLTGGNLSLLAHSIGTPFEVQTTGRLLYVEEVNEVPYRVDRMVGQLALAGKFRGILGMLIGRFSGCRPSEREKSRELLLEAVAGRDIPVAAGFPAGHGPGNGTFPLGVQASLETDTRSLTFTPFLAP